MRARRRVLLGCARACRLRVCAARLEDLARDGLQRVLGPRVVPVEVVQLTSDGNWRQREAEGLADGREGEHEVEVVAHARDEEGAQRVARLGHSALPCARRAQRVEDLVELVGRKEAGHLARVEDRVDVLEERLGDDLRVGEEEGEVRALARPRAVEQS